MATYIIGVNEVEEKLYYLSGSTWAEFSPQIDFANPSYGLWGASTGELFIQARLAELYYHYDPDANAWSSFAAPSAAQAYDIHGASASCVYAACTTEIHKWDGTSWSIVKDGLTDVQSIWCDETGQYVYAATGDSAPDEIWKSSDYGVTWSNVWGNITTDLGYDPGAPCTAWGEGEGDSTVYLGTSSASQGRVLKYDGSTWTDLGATAHPVYGLWTNGSVLIAAGHDTGQTTYHIKKEVSGAWPVKHSQGQTTASSIRGRAAMGIGDRIVNTAQINSNTERLFLSDDAGDTWALMSTSMSGFMNGLALWTQVARGTVKDDLTQREGVRRRLALLIDGIPYTLWQDDGGESTDGLKCLLPPAESSLALDLATLKPQQSGMTFDLLDVEDPDDDTLKYFPQVFNVGGAADESLHWRLANGTAPNQVLDADATTIPLADATDVPASGTLHIGTETFSHTGVSGNDLTGCTRGLYPAVGSAWGLTHARPMAVDDSQEQPPLVTQKIWTMHGRRVRLVVVTLDRDTGIWHALADAETLWVGRIANDVQYVPNGPGNLPVYRLSCESLISDLDRKIAQYMPRKRLYPIINLSGKYGRTFTIVVKNLFMQLCALAVVTIPAGWYTEKKLWRVMSILLQGKDPDTGRPDTNTWKDIPGFRRDTWVALKRMRSGDNNLKHVMTIGTDTAGVITIDGKYNGVACHALAALGFTQLAGKVAMYGPADLTDLVGTAAGGIDIEAPKAPALAYQPTHRQCNNSSLAIDAFDSPFWEDQGDDTTQTQGFVKFTGAKRLMGEEGAEGETQNYLPRYTSSQWVLSLNDGYSFRQFTLGESALWVPHTDGYVAQRADEPDVMAEQVYMPRYKSVRNIGPFEALLPVLASTGTPDYNGRYDRLPLPLSAAIDSSLINDASFREADLEIETHPTVAGRRLNYNPNPYFIDEAISPLELYMRECLLYGFALVWSGGKIKLAKVMEPTIDQQAITLSDSTGVDPWEKTRLRSAMDAVRNRYKCKVIYDPHKGSYLKPIIITDGDSRQLLGGHTGAVDIEHPGLPFNARATNMDKAQAASIMTDLVLGRIVALPRFECEVSAGPEMERQIFTGDVVRFTNDYLPSIAGDGTLGIDCPALVINKRWNYKTWVGRIGLVLLTQYRRYFTAGGDVSHSLSRPWGPSGLVDKTVQNGGLLAVGTATVPKYVVTLLPDFFGSGGAMTNYDLQRFEQGDYVTLIAGDGSDPSADPLAWEDLEVYDMNVATCTLYVAGNDLSGWDYTRECFVNFASRNYCYHAQRDRGAFWGNYATRRMNQGLYAVERWG